MPSIIPRGVPFAQIPHDLITDTDLSPYAVRVYCYLVRRANDEARAWPSVRRVARETGMTDKTVRRAVAALEETGWVNVERTYNPAEERHEVNRYTVWGTKGGVGYEIRQGSDTVAPPGGVPDTSELDPSLTTSTELVAATPLRGPDGLSIAEEEQMAARPRNPWWDVTVELFGEPGKGQGRLYGRFVAGVITGAGPANRPLYTPDEIRRRAGLLAELWGHKTVTVASLEKWWSRFDAQIGQVTDADVEAFTAAGDRAATLERLADE